ncbi:MAG: ATP-binding protein [Nitrospira sp.]|nr:ATP-binding protein [Nitrospira sp.]
MKETVYTRHIEARLKEAMEDSPVVLIQGPRQCGKTTLAQMVGKPAGYAYRSFDDEDLRSFAETDPIGFVKDLPERVILDEVQKVPRLFSSIKLSVDRNRTPGRFILTGSVNVLQVRQITDSLAGRMQIIRLHPLSQSEISQTPPTFLDALFSSGFRHRQNKPVEENIVHRIVAGGYPAALRLTGERRRTAWYKNYLEALVQRDVPDISNIRSPEILSNLLALAAAQTAQLLSVNGLASSFQLSRPTVHDYLSLLKKMFLVETLPAWHNNRVKRLIKTPKLHLSDTGVACALMDLDHQALASDRSLFGHVLETFVFQELQRQASGHEETHKFFHYREKVDKETEVDIVIRRGAFHLAGVEVKASATINKSDFHGLRRLKATAGKHFACGVLVYNGETSGKIDDKLYAVPLRSLWETT